MDPAPIRAVVIGIIDEISIEGELVVEHGVARA